MAQMDGASSPVCAACHEDIRGANKTSGRVEGAEHGDFGDVLTVPEGSIHFDGGEKDDGLVTTNGVLPTQFKGQFNAFERIVLLASGNLQSLVSAWFARPVCVKVKKNEEVTAEMTKGYLFDRIVEIHVDGLGLFATAHSAVNIHSKALYDPIKNGTIGLGQLFRSLDSMPRFTLLGAGRPSDGSGLWRLYELHAPAISVRILETFPGEMLKMVDH